MSRPRILTDADRAFFADVVRLVFTNPFSTTRIELDTRLGGASPNAPEPLRRAKLVRAVSARIARLDRRAPMRLDRYANADRDVLWYAFLFEVYHRFKDDFDRLIADQLEDGAGSIPVPFAAAALRLLDRRGFPKNEALRNFALYYQLRRAFFFIDRMVGTSASMRELRVNLWNNIFTSDIRWYNRHLWNRMEEFSTLLLGETGTGKGTAATAIGRSGFIPFDDKKGRFRESFTKALVSLNLSQFPSALIESELFGHKKGSFTGAVEDHPGVFASCSPYGSIFLDEIGEVSVPTQIKLLQVLQERWFTPVGSHEQLRFRGRVVAATNRSLDELRSEGRLRDDFFYRLCSDVVVVPPLRRRIAEDPKELETLVDHTLRRLVGDEAPELTDFVLSRIRRDLGTGYPWPGNVRELEQCVRRILIRRSYEGDRRAISDAQSDVARGIDAEAFDALGLQQAYCALLYRRYGAFGRVARITGLDRRTVKKYVQNELESSAPNDR